MTMTWRFGSHTDRHQEIPCLNFCFPSGPIPRYILFARPERHPQPGSRRGGRMERAPCGRPISPSVGDPSPLRWEDRPGAVVACHAPLPGNSCTGVKAVVKRQIGVCTSSPPPPSPGHLLPRPAAAPFPRLPSAVRGGPSLPSFDSRQEKGRGFLQGSHSAGCWSSKSQPSGPLAFPPAG